MALRIERGEFYGWSVIRLANDNLSLALAPAIGGRIVSLQLAGRELLFLQAEHAGETFRFEKEQDLDSLKRRMGFRLWGGDKTWVAPQSAWSERMPPLELDAGQYTAGIEGSSVLMVSPICRETGLQIERRVELLDSGEIVLDQQLINRSDQPVRRGIWDVTQVLRPFEVYLPAPLAAIRAYPEEGQSVRLRDGLLRKDGDYTVIPCNEPAHFKFGGMLDRGAVLALRHEPDATISWLREFSIDPSAPYAHNAMAEVYNSPDMNYLEIEVHAPLRTLAPGESIAHAQRWQVQLIHPA